MVLYVICIPYNHIGMITIPLTLLPFKDFNDANSDFFSIVNGFNISIKNIEEPYFFIVFQFMKNN